MTLAVQIVATVPFALLLCLLTYEWVTEGIYDWRDVLIYGGGTLYLVLVLLAIWRAS